MNKTLSYISLTQKAGCLITGEENTGIAAHGGKARLLLLAGDASENAARRVRGFSDSGGEIPLITLPFTKEELSSATGKAGCSMAAVTDIGFACEIVARLAEDEPEKYAELKEILEAKREKALRRKSESTARDRARKPGKRRNGI